MKRKQKDRLRTIGRNLIRLRDEMGDQIERDLIISALTDIQQVLDFLPKRTRHSRLTLLKIKVLYDRGITYKQITVETGASRDTIRRQSRLYGWRPRWRKLTQEFATRTTNAEREQID